MKQAFFNLLKLFFILTLLTTQAKADSATSPAIPEAKQAIDNLQKMGQGRFTWWGLSVYDAELWSGTAPTEFDYTKHSHWLQLKYARDFKGANIAESSREQIEKQGLGNPQTLDNWQKQLTDLFPNIQEDDTLSALYVPNQPTRFFHNGQPIGQITSADLAQAFMGIWLSSATSEPKLRRQLIGLN